MANARKLWTWVGIPLGVFFLLLVLTAAIVPLVVDVDQFRPKMLEVARGYLNGELKLGKLHLSLWGQVKIQVDGFVLSDSKGRNVLSAGDVNFHIPFSSLLWGAPQLTFTLKNPEVTVIKDKLGINALTLMKTQAAASAAPGAPATAVAAPAPTSALKSLPSIVIQSRLGVEFVNAKFAYVDKLADLVSQVNSLSLRVKDLSLSRPTEIEVSANLDTRMGKVLLVRGPASLRASASPVFKGSDFEKASLALEADLSAVEIDYGDLFHKSSGVPMGMKGTLSATPSSATIEKMVARFHNAEVTASGGLSGLGGDAPIVKFAAASNDIAMDGWAALIPLLKAYELSGAAAFKARADGPLAKLQYQADFSLKDLGAKAPYLKAVPRIDASVHLVTDKVEKMELTLQAPGSELRASGSVVSFSKPKVQIQVASTGIDLDQLLDFPKSPPKKEGAAPNAPADAKASVVAVGKKAAADFDAMLAPLRDNQIAAAVDAVLGFQLKFVKAMNVRIEPLEGAFTLKSLLANLDRFHMGAFDGVIASTASFDLKGKTPRYQFAMDVAGLDLKKAVTSQMEMFKNTAYGKLAFKMKGHGASFNPDAAKSNLQASGNLSVAEAKFATMDVGQIAADGITKALDGIASQLPGLKGKKLVLGNIESGYEKLAATFSIAGGVFSMPDFSAVSGRHRGLDVKGATTIGLKDYKLAAHWVIIDTYNVTGAANLSVENSGVRVNRILAEPGQPVQFPVDIGGTLFAPEPSYTSVAEALAKVALGNAARGLQAKLIQEAGNRAKTELQKALPGDVRKVLDVFKF